MTELLLPRTEINRQTRGAEGVFRPTARVVRRDAVRIKWIIRYTFYAFVFSLPFEEAVIAGGATLPKLFGLALAGSAFLQRGLCYELPPKEFGWFGAYLVIYVLWGGFLLLTPPDVPEFSGVFIDSCFRLAQLFFLFWVSYNLLRHDSIAKGALWALATSSILLSILQIVGVTSDVSKSGRVSAFDTNPNGLATVLSLGLVALVGLAYGRTRAEWKARLAFWFGAGVVAIAIVQTGSRGAVAALAGALLLFSLKGKSLAVKLKFGLIAFVGIIALFAASYHIETVRVRWEQAFYDENLAGRERIFPEAVGMILESPVIGWGPINHLWELGSRLGLPMRDEHNVYLWLLAETGVVGAIPFLAGLWLCMRSAWRSRQTISGILPLVMLLFVVVLSLKGTYHHRKYYWVVLAYALAAGSYSGRSLRLKVAVSTNHNVRSGFVSSRSFFRIPPRRG